MVDTNGGRTGYSRGMAYLIAALAIAVVVVLLWRARPVPQRQPLAPDDDPDFLLDLRNRIQRDQD